MTDSFPATERTPCLSCDMSGALGSTLLRRYDPPAKHETDSEEDKQRVLDVMKESFRSTQVAVRREIQVTDCHLLSRQITEGLRLHQKG